MDEYYKIIKPNGLIVSSDKYWEWFETNELDLDGWYGIFRKDNQCLIDDYYVKNGEILICQYSGNNEYGPQNEESISWRANNREDAFRMLKLEAFR